MSIKRFETTVDTSRHAPHSRHFVRFVRIQSPLTIVVGHSKGGTSIETGHLTTFTGKAAMRYGSVSVAVAVVRTTYWTDNGRRKLKGQTYTQDRVDVNSIGTSSLSYTNFGRRRSRYASGAPSGSPSVDRFTYLTTSTVGLSFDVDTFLAMLLGVAETGAGEGLADWLRENSTEIAPLFDLPGWMPLTWGEFSTVRDERKKEEEARRRAAVAAVALVASGYAAALIEPPEQDRWR